MLRVYGVKPRDLSGLTRREYVALVDDFQKQQQAQDSSRG